MSTYGPLKTTGARIRDILRRLGSVQKPLSPRGLELEILKRAKREVPNTSGKVLAYYAKDQREPLPTTLEWIAACDPLGRGPAWLAGWDPDAVLGRGIDARAQQRAAVAADDSPAGPLKSSLPYYRNVSEDRPKDRRKRGA